MAAFSYQHYPLHLDSVFFPNSPLKNLSGFMEEPNTSYVSQFYPPPSAVDLVGVSDNEPSSVTKKQSSDSSSVNVDNNKLESGEQVTQQLNCSISMTDKTKETNSNASSSTSTLKEDKGGVSRKRKTGSSEMKEEEKKPKAKKKVAEEEPPTGYIHVRARRGQATDSHSLAERVRREKISERMKILQRLVPGCDKVTGKALMLDEIINYVQSLQNQVEFLSMKLASVNPLFYDFCVDLDALTLRSDQGLSNYTPSLSPMQQQSNPAPPTVFADATTTTTAAIASFAGANSYHPVIDAPASLLLQGQRPNDFIQGSGSLMWDVNEQRHKFLNQSWLISNNLCSFH